MAKFTEADWDIARTMFECGKSLGEIQNRTGIDKGQISRTAKANEWEKGKNQQLISDAARVEIEKSKLSQQSLIIFDNIVNDRVIAEKFFSNAAVKNVSESLKVPCQSQQDFKFRAETINKGRETVLGKSPDTAIQINNSAPKPTKIELTAL